MKEPWEKVHFFEEKFAGKQKKDFSAIGNFPRLVFQHLFPHRLSSDAAKLIHLIVELLEIEGGLVCDHAALAAVRKQAEKIISLLFIDVCFLICENNCRSFPSSTGV